MNKNMGKPDTMGKGKRKLTVTKCDVLREWRKDGSDKVTYLYTVEAVDEHGRKIEQELRSFAELEVGVLEEYEVEPYNHPEYGTSYTLKRPRQHTTKRLVALEKRVADIADRLSAAEAALKIAPPEVKEEPKREDNIPW